MRKQRKNIFLLLLLISLKAFAIPEVEFSMADFEKNSINNGRTGVYLVGQAKLTDLIGHKVGFLGSIYKDGKIVSQGKFHDMYFIDKVSSQNIPYFKVFIPTDSLPQGRYDAYVHAYDYSVKPPKLIPKPYHIFLRISDNAVTFNWLSLPSAKDSLVRISITSTEPLGSVSVSQNKSKEVENGEKSFIFEGSYKVKPGRNKIDVSAFKESFHIGDDFTSQSRTVYVMPSVLIQNIKLVPNSYGGSYHRIVYDYTSKLPIGTRYGLRATICDEKGNIIGKSKLNYRFQNDTIDSVLDDQILIASKDLKLDSNKDYKVWLIPYLCNNDNWESEMAGAFSVSYKPNNEPIFRNDENGVRFDWLEFANEVKSSATKIKVGIKSPKTLNNVSLKVNGQMLRGVNVVRNDGYDMVLTETIALAEGHNEICITAQNSDGKSSSLKEIVRINHESNKKTNNKQAALVIGNAKYPGNELYNTINDASDVSSELSDLGFDVMLLKDGTKVEMDKFVEQFASKIALMDVSYFFFAGHAMQLDGVNYLIPIDAIIRSNSDIEKNCINLDNVINMLDASGCELKIISLDACRNNPFGKTNMQKGLARLNTPAAIGTMVSFATAPGMVALDGSGRNSPYTSSLVNVLKIPQLTLDQVFNKVGLQVVKETNKQQQPWVTKTVVNGDYIINNSKK